MSLLAIETSCDETSIAILKDGHQILSHFISSQIKHHQPFGGVVPELASRKHTEIINILIEKALKEAKLDFTDLTACAVTCGPGLEGALLIGVMVAKTISSVLNIPLIGVHHIWGHIYAHFLTESPPKFPFICLIVSGGHTMLVLVKGHYEAEILGQTRDDAAGEAFDKVARALELGYPGGPVIEKEALSGNPKAFAFPRAMKKQGYDFSFSGLKTAVMQKIHALRQENSPLPIADLAASFQKAVVDVLIFKTLRACEEYNVSSVIIAGGVSANQSLKTTMSTEALKKGIQVLSPPLQLCTDNAAMIGAAGFYHYQKFQQTMPNIKVRPNLNLIDYVNEIKNII